MVWAGIARVYLGEKGPAYLGANSLFWAKMAVFAGVGGLSILPTLQFLRWRREARRDPYFQPRPQSLGLVRRVLYLEAGLIAVLPILAAGMAHSFGS